MVARHRIHSFLFLLALAVAGCAITGDQTPQTSVGGAPSRPKTVLIYDLVFSPDVVVADREFAVRLNRDIGDLVVSQDLIAKRVNAEIVATIITILRDEAGLNARSGIDDDPALNDTALVVDGQLRAADRSTRSPRNPVDFRSGVVAEIAVSRTSDGKKAQLLAFAAQAQKGVGAGPLAEAQNAAIKAALASQSVPTQNLSPDIEAQARGLGRAIADKITAYAIQQGWVHKADLPERPVDTGPKNQPQKLPAAAAKQSGPSGPTTAGSTIPCNAFTKNDRGNWYVRGPVTINLGTAENRTLHNLEITPKFFTIGGVDLYEAIQKACGGSQRR